MALLNVIVFSKNRACQLDLFLRSMEAFVRDRELIRISVFYTATTEAFDRGYTILRSRFGWASFVDERACPGGFQDGLLDLLDTEIPYLAFFVDDCLFKNAFSLGDAPFRRFEEDPGLICLSLRLGNHITYCYSLDMESPPPPFESDYVWDWRGQPGDWGYPMSLDGHIFRTGELAPLLREVRYRHPNALETQLARHPLAPRKMICYEESRVMNLPINKVQTVYPNRSGDVDPAELNDAFVRRGKEIDLRPLANFTNASAHQEFVLQFVDRC